MLDPVLQIRDLNVRRAGSMYPASILNGISLDLSQGETLCLVGESGSGKTVTALSVMGLLSPADLRIVSGSIRVAGEELVGAPEEKLRDLRATSMAMVFQEPMTALNPVMTIGAQIDEVLVTHTSLGRSARRRQIYEMLEQADLANASRIVSAYPHQLSGGQRQRAMIAMALILRPKLLIADEPTSALDVRTQKQILELLRRLREEHGTAVLFVTHDMGVVAEIADRVAVMRRGYIVEIGARKSMLEAPRNAYTQELLAAVPTLSPHAPRPARSGEVALAAHSLWKTYDPSFLRRGKTQPAVVNVDLQLDAGRTLGIVGESGSGKSTLARCLLRLTDPNEGEVRLGKVDITSLSPSALKPHRRDLQIVVQDPYRALNPRMKIADIVIEGPLNFGVPRAQALQDAPDLLAMVGLLPELVHARPHQLSGGQRQRVALARALALKPKVLVADEAVSALDVTTQAQILQLLADLQDRLGLAILFITHDLRVAAQICDDVVIMHEGRIVERGRAADILTKPRHAYTQALIDAAPGRHWNFAGSRPAGTA